MAWSTSIKFVSIPFYRINDGSEFFFENKTLLDQYFLNHVVSNRQYEQQSYMRVAAGEIKVKVNADELLSECPNFIMFKNSDFGDRWFIANIISVNYVNVSVSRVAYAMHPLYSFWDLLDFSKQSYIARRTWSGSKDKLDEIMELPYEDIDVGESYQICDKVFDFNNSDKSYETDLFIYILMTKKMTTSGSNHKVESGNISHTYLSGDQVKTFTTKNGYNSVLYGYVMNAKTANILYEKGIFSESCDLVNALQVSQVLPFGRDLFKPGMKNIKDSIRVKLSDGSYFDGSSLPSDCEFYDQSSFGDLFTTKEITGWCSRLNDFINKSVLNNYKSPFNPSLPSSAIGVYLYRFPFSQLEIYDGTNTAIVKIEEIDRNYETRPIKNNKLILQKYGSLGQAPLLAYSLASYQNSSYFEDYNNIVKANNIVSMTATNFLSVPVKITNAIINSMSAAFFQSNQAQINAQRQNLKTFLNASINNASATLQASANQIRTNQRTSEMTAYTQAQNAGIQNSTEYLISSNNAMTEYSNTMTSANSEMMQAVVNGGAQALNFHPIAAGASVINGFINQQAQQVNAGRTYTNFMRNLASQQSANSQMIANTLASNNKIAQLQASAAMVTAYTQYGNSIRMAQASYTSEIRSLNARLQDIANVPPSVQSLGNNSSVFDLMFNRDVISFTTKTMPVGVVQRVIDYYVRNGFLTNRSETIQSIFDKFKDNAGFYIQTVNANISGNIPQEFLMAIVDQFNAGIYFWKPENYLDYDEMRGV